MPDVASFQQAEQKQEVEKPTRVGDWEYQGGEGIWEEWKNVKTGQSSMKKYTMTKSSSFDTCDHYYQLFENGSDIQCAKCGLGGKIVWGKNFLKDGKIVTSL